MPWISPGRFSLVTVYEEYEALIARVTNPDLSESKRTSLLKKTSIRYRRAFEHVLFDNPSIADDTVDETSEPAQTDSEAPQPRSLLGGQRLGISV